MSTVAQERDDVLAQFRAIEHLEEIERELPAEAVAAARKLHAHVRSELRRVPPVPVTAASTLLGLSERTVRTWAREGVLRAVPAVKPIRLDAVQFHEVLHVVRQLRELGRDRDLIDEVWHRLQDQALLERDDLQESLGQFRRGEVIEL